MARFKHCPQRPARLTPGFVRAEYRPILACLPPPMPPATRGRGWRPSRDAGVMADLAAHVARECALT